MDAHLDSLSDAELGRLWAEAAHSAEALARENAVLRAYLCRHVSAQEADEWAADDEPAGGRSRSGGRRRPAGRSRRPRPAAATLDQKLEVASAELDAARRETAAMQGDAARTLAKLRALAQQSDAQLAALTREAHEFQREVVVGGEHALTGRVRAERVVRYYEGSLRRKDTALEQLRLRCEALRGSLAKDRASLRRKEQAGDTLHYVDFLQLQIENKQLSGRLEERNGELTRLKGSAGATHAAQGGLKAALAALLRECGALRGELRGRGAVQARLRGELALAADELAALRATAASLAKAAQLARESESGGGGGGGGGSSALPVTLDYMGLVALQSAIQRELAAWARKVDVAALAAANAAAARHRHRGGGGGGGEDEARRADDDAETSRCPWRVTGVTPAATAAAAASGGHGSGRMVAGFPSRAAPSRWARLLPSPAHDSARPLLAGGGGSCPSLPAAAATAEQPAGGLALGATSSRPASFAAVARHGGAPRPGAAAAAPALAVAGVTVPVGALGSAPALAPGPAAGYPYKR
jgi:hypothetical protein